MHRILFSLLALLSIAPCAIEAQSHTFQHESLPCLNKKFTIVAHIFKDSLGNPGASEAAISQAIQDINPFFAPICVSFEVCEFRYHDNWQHDVLEDPTTEIPQIKTKYHADFRINMYFVTDFTSDIDACGLADLSGIANAFGSGIVVRKACINVLTIAHEMGHFFSLKHTFEGNGIELVNGSNATTAGDGIADTPADPYVPGDPLELYVNSDCLFINTKTDANGEYYNPDLGNIMSYYECGACGFTWGQLNQMAQTYLNAGVKLW
ncbi:MAG: hypothetical protein IPH12_06160 [Saprospirales bacterium]|nr:hypothetical protein [Saprospirales bacterium]